MERPLSGLFINASAFSHEQADVQTGPTTPSAVPRSKQSFDSYLHLGKARNTLDKSTPYIVLNVGFYDAAKHVQLA